MTKPMNLNDLKAPFPPEAVHWRVGATNQAKTKGMALAYIDARDVMDRLDAVCGPEWWGTHFEEIGGRVVCTIAIRVPMRVPHPLGPDMGAERIEYGWTKKSDGAGDTDHEAEKGGLSDAFKRAAVHWGIGRYLYRLPSPWVAIEAAGKSYKIAESERSKLLAVLGAPGKPASARGGNGKGEEPASAPPSPTGLQAPAPGKRLKERCIEIAAAYDGAPDIAELNKLEARLRDEIAAMPDKAKSMLAAAFHRNREALAPLDDTEAAVADLAAMGEAP